MVEPHSDAAAGRRTDSDAHDVVTARALVGTQFALLGLLVLLPARADWPVSRWLTALGVACGVVGVAVMVAGATTLGRGLTALPLPSRRAQLRTGGLYRHVRHPIYSGLLLTAAAITIGSGSRLRALTFGALVVLLTIKARWEETRLAGRFEEYADYADRTPRFVPRRRRLPPPA